MMQAQNCSGDDHVGMNVDLQFFLSLAGVLVSVLSFIFAYFKYMASQARRIGKLEERSKDIDEIKKKLDQVITNDEEKRERLKALEVKMELFWQAVQGSVINMLKHPTTERKDVLLDKLADKTITINELEELKDLLKCDVSKKKREVGPRVESSERVPLTLNREKATAFVVARIDQLLYDGRRVISRNLVQK